MARHSILLIISGSIAAYKSLELIRRLREHDIDVRCILTKGGAEFITPLSVASLSGNAVYTDLFSLKDESEMGHIRLVREAQLVVVAPASANLISQMAHGAAADLATAALLANDKKLIVAPAMNAQMWKHRATRRNVNQIINDGALVVEPESGSLACGEVGEGRMADTDTILTAILHHFNAGMLLKGLSALVTSGPTYEAIDPVRFLGNRSSGRQGHAIAAEMASRGINVTLVTGPTALPDPLGVTVKHVASAKEMLDACEKSLPVDVAVCAAAVSDWGVSKVAAHKIKKRANHSAPTLLLVENPDILHHIAVHKKRPKLVIGFAAETENLIKNASEKRKKKGCDWIVANEVDEKKGFDVSDNEVTLITAKTQERWPLMSKEHVAEKLVERIIEQLRRKAA